MRGARDTVRPGRASDNSVVSSPHARAVKLMGAAVEAKYNYLFGVNRSLNDNRLIFLYQIENISTSETSDLKQISHDRRQGLDV